MFENQSSDFIEITIEENFEDNTLIQIIEDIITKNLHLGKIKVNLEKFKKNNDRKKEYITN